jgi:methylated-DNA-[protein]-cysteine S-methyltransferase
MLKSVSFTPLENSPSKLDRHLMTRTSSLTGFKEAVYDIVSKIPKGKVLTYKQVATYAGRPNAARAVGMFMSKNYNEKIPCHRVVRSDGKIGNYNRGGEVRKIKRLREEGAII